MTRICFLPLLVSIGLCRAQVCTENGRIAGLDAIARSVGDSDNTIILHVYGGINCYGVVTEWTFYKSTGCSDVFFQIWRPTGDNYLLVGQNEYVDADQHCPDTEGEVTLRVPANEQIPVQPGDVIGWTQKAANNMIQYESLTPGQEVIEICDGADPTIPGFNTRNCTGNGSPWDREVSLQVKVVTGPRPEFNNLPNVVEIPENSLPGTDRYPEEKLYDVQASIEKNVIDPSMALPVELQFSLTTNPPKFAIENHLVNGYLPSTGRITLTEPLDFETQKEHILYVRVDGLGLYSESTLTVRVIDINEPHSITNLDFTTSLSAETARAGDAVFKIEVHDDDANPDPLFYGIDATDTLDPLPPPFVMDNKTGILRVSEDLYGKVWASQYILDLVAWDFMYKDVGQLTVILENIRSPPFIHNLDETIDVPEDAPTGSDIFQVVAESRYPELLTYEILEVTPFDMYNKFVIDAKSGWIETTAFPEFDYAVNPTISIEVLASDDIGSGSGTLTINLQWVNRPPIFAPKLYKADIPEKCGAEDAPQECRREEDGLPARLPWEIPDLRLRYDHRDEDIPSNDSSQCTVMPGFKSDLFSVYACQSILVVESIDVNSNPELMSINLTLKIEDNLGLSDTALVFITVYDINDHNPVFSNEPYESSVSENTEGGKSILQVTATDDDFGENGTVRYSLQDISNYNGTFYFQIDPFTGVIYTKQPIDYELLMRETGNNIIEFNARATDKGINPNNAVSRVTITVGDVNDNRPLFDCKSNKWSHTPVDPSYQCFYNLDVRSDPILEHIILNLTAYDIDPEDLEPTYYILNPKEHLALNTTDKKGVLYINSSLHVYHKYEMICMVIDQGYPQLKARPPSIVRLDTFHAEDHLVDITLDVESWKFPNTSFAVQAFMIKMISFLEPWFPRYYADLHAADRDVITIYALKDNSSFLYANLDKPKQFVHVNDLLDKLRKNIHGDPRDDFKNDFDDFSPVLVMPTYPNWWIHTLPGLVTIFCLCLVLLLILIIALIYCCRRYQVCCFKSKRKLPTKHAWMNDKTYKENAERESKADAYDDVSEHDNETDSDDEIKTTTGSNQQNEGEQKGSNDSRPSTASTVHSLIYDKK